MVTPFTPGGQVDYKALERLVAHVTAGGVDFLVALGTTAETATLTADEKRDVLACVKGANGGKLPLVVGIGGNCTAEVVRTFGQYDLEGVEAILSVTPYYNKPTQEGLFQHYRVLAAEAPRPLILYNVPSRTGVNMSAETTLRLAHGVKNILGTKEACGSAAQIACILRDRPEGFRVISGDDGMTLAIMAMGGDGVISVAANAFPFAMAALAKGDAAMHLRLLEVIDALFEEGNPAGVKAALALKGICESQVRLPLMPASGPLREKMKTLVDKYGL